MVNDSERNQLYYKAIRKWIKKLIDQRNEVNALDIGTGIGLLSMMWAHQATGWMNYFGVWVSTGDFGLILFLFINRLLFIGQMMSSELLL